MIYIYIFIVILILLIISIFTYWIIASFKIFKNSFYKKKSYNKPLTSPDKKQILKHDDMWLDSNTFTLLTIPSSSKKYLNGYYLKNNNSHKYLISVHGYRGCFQELSLICHYIYEKLDFNVLMIEQRGHNNSPYKVITFSNKECLDLLKWINYIVINDPQAEICLLGFSMGASTVLNTLGLKLPTNVKCAISDSAFSSTKEEYFHIVQSKSKHNFFNYISYLGIKLISLFHGFSFTKNYPTKNLKKSKTPTLLIHGSIDTFVPLYMLDKIYDSIPSSTYKQKEIFINSWHGMGIINEPERYVNTISIFINKFIK